MNTIQRLEHWQSKHKARWAKIEIDDGYGATCWRVDLHGEGKRSVHSAECFFFEGSTPENVVAAGDEDESFPGLEPTIVAALDRWDKLFSVPACTTTCGPSSTSSCPTPYLRKWLGAWWNRFTG